jgi:hypothetical protein
MGLDFEWDGRLADSEFSYAIEWESSKAAKGLDRGIIPDGSGSHGTLFVPWAFTT